MDAFNVRDGQPIAGDVPFAARAGRLGAGGEVSPASCHPAPKEGDPLAVHCAGAYGFVMNSNDNTRGRAAEVPVDSSAAAVLRRHELTAGESLLPD